MNAVHPGLILVVDDNSINRYLLAQHVAQQGHRVVSAGDGREALHQLLAERVDLVLLDLDMPEMDGYAVLAAMKEDSRLRELPVIMISGVDEIHSVVQCIERGAEDYLAKPFNPVLLRARINACLEKKRLRDEERKKTEALEKALLQLKQTQDQLVVQEKLASLGALTAGIAHEIKNPLNFVTNFAQLSGDLIRELRAELGKQRDRLESAVQVEVDELLDRLQQNFSKICEHGQRADRIVAGMLLHSRGGRGERQWTDLNTVVAQDVSLAYHGMRARDPSFQINLETDYDRSLGQIYAVPQNLSRVFLNLADNACHAVREKSRKAGTDYVPTIRICTQNLGDRVEVRIRDNGDGIPENIREQIFEPFFTTKPSGHGTGLGLPISHEIIVREHQGELRVESEVGSYTEFVVTLPRNPRKELKS
jgi:signal transduction histidine kinase